MGKLLDRYYIIDRDDLIIEVDPDWTKFARENDAPRAQQEFVLHQTIWDFLSGETKEIYRSLIAALRNRKRKKQVRFKIRCDALGLIGETKVTIKPLKEGKIRFEIKTVKTRKRGPYSNIESLNGFSIPLVICSFCNHVFDGKIFCELEDAFDSEALSKKSVYFPDYQLCDECREWTRELIESLS